VITSDAERSSLMNTPAYISRFGLKREPFSETVEDDFFFSEAEGGQRLSLSRLQRLNLLLHLAPYSDVLLVTGEAGIGKTTLLHQFLAKVDRSWRVCPVNAGPKVNNEVVYQSLMREFAKEDAVLSDGASQIDSLRQHIRALRESVQSPILIIDDAHELSDQVLKFVLHLVQADKNGGKLLSVIMFSEPSIAIKLAASELIPLRNLISHSFELTPFNEEDTASYIKHRLKLAGLTAENPFTPAVVKVIHSSSQGIPGRINELAQVVLNNSAAMESAPLSFAMPSKTEVFKRYGLIGMVAVLIIVALLFQDSINTVFMADSSKETGRIEVQHEQPEQAPSAGVVAQSAPRANTNQPDANDVDPGVLPDMEQQLPEELVEHESATGRIARITALDSEVAHDPSGEVTSGIPEPAPSDKAGGKHVIDGRDDRKITTVEVVVAGSEKQVTTIDNTANAKKSDVPKPVSQEKQSDKIIAAKETEDTIHREDWLLSQNPQHYTLQLMAIREKAIIVKFIKDNHLQDHAAYFNTYNNGKEWLAVVYGIYPTRKEADIVSKQLQDRIASVKPWIRTFKSVQEAIDSYRAQ